MKLGIVGLSQSGKTTIFRALTGARSDGESMGSARADAKIATIVVHDDRVDFLKEMYQPKKTAYAKIEYLLPSQIQSPSASKAESGIWNQIRPCDALLLVVKNFKGLDGEVPSPETDFWKMEEEMILSDLVVAEKRMERIELDRKRGKAPPGDEPALVQKCCDILGKGTPIRNHPELVSNPALKGFTFLSAKPILVIINNDDEDEDIPAFGKTPQGVELMAVRGKLEEDIAGMSDEEADEFKAAYHIQESVLDRVIRSSYRLLDRISFFTVGPDEVKAWPISNGTPAVKAAGTIHSDIEKGFIRAETLSFDDLKTHGT